MLQVHIQSGVGKEISLTGTKRLSHTPPVLEPQTPVVSSPELGPQAEARVTVAFLYTQGGNIRILVPMGTGVHLSPAILVYSYSWRGGALPTPLALGTVSKEHGWEASKSKMPLGSVVAQRALHGPSGKPSSDMHLLPVARTEPELGWTSQADERSSPPLG